MALYVASDADILASTAPTAIPSPQQYLRSGDQLFRWSTHRVAHDGDLEARHGPVFINGVEMKGALPLPTVESLGKAGVAGDMPFYSAACVYCLCRCKLT